MRRLTVVLAAALATLAAPASAEVATLRCHYAGGSSNLDFTLDVDLTASTVTVVTGNPPRTVHADITDRTITYPGYIAGWQQRIDRRTGVWDQYTPQLGWRPNAGMCSRVEGKPVL
ncbi:MAG: hypothetical protein KGL11_02450 [Alphaproteobacteria bacterium]|nr:hypothetical protein [Alphaproteobacteria bacterium]